MSWSAIRRESLFANEEGLFSQQDGSFDWFESSMLDAFGDQKVTETPYIGSLSPSSTISSGPSSATTSPSTSTKDTGFDEDSASDAGFESDKSEYEPYYVDNDQYTVINGKAYLIPSIPQPVFGQSFMNLPPLPHSTLSPIPEVRHLPQLPPSRDLPLSSQTIASQSPPSVIKLPSKSHHKSKRSRGARAKKSKRPRSQLILAEDSDRDADGESDHDASDDDEYVPSPRMNSRKRTRRLSAQLDAWSFAAAHKSSARASRAPSQVGPHEGGPNKRLRNSPPSRNVQVPSLSQPVDAVELSFTCPDCGWIQKNKRMPDFKRHLLTHTRPSNEDQTRGWWCKGVLAENIPGYQGETYQFAGKLRVGGCLKTFSRRDALKRHLDNPNVPCMGCIDD